MSKLFKPGDAVHVISCYSTRRAYWHHSTGIIKRYDNINMPIKILVLESDDNEIRWLAASTRLEMGKVIEYPSVDWIRRSGGSIKKIKLNKNFKILYG